MTSRIPTFARLVPVLAALALPLHGQVTVYASGCTGTGPAPTLTHTGELKPGFPNTVSISGAARGSCQPDGSFLEGEQLFFYGNGASAESPAVFEVYASGFTADVYARSTCSNAMTESRCAVGTSIGGGINRARIEVPVGATVFADGLSGGSSIYSLYYDP